MVALPARVTCLDPRRTYQSDQSESELLISALFLLSRIVADTDSENCGFVTSLCPDLRLWPALYDIYLCLKDLRIGQLCYLRRNWESVFTAVEEYGHF